jgi:hypothetical protein
MAKRPADDDGTVRPSPRDAVARATAAAGPKVAKAVEAAGPQVEKAAAGAGKLLGTLAQRARETAKAFSEGSGADDTQAKKAPDASTDAPRPRPKPGPPPSSTGK